MALIRRSHAVLQCSKNLGVFFDFRRQDRSTKQLGDLVELSAAYKIA